MQIETILTPERCKVKLSGGSKKRIIENIAQLFADSQTQLDVTEVYRALMTREKLGSTGLGAGIAIPHCRFNTDGKTFGACVTLDQPVDFDSVDGKPVDLIFAMLVPEDAESSHLETLASLAELMQQESVVNKLRAAQNNEELYTLTSRSQP